MRVRFLPGVFHKEVIMNKQEPNLTLDRDEVFEYLVELRDSGRTNMFGAGPYIQNEFMCTKEEAKHWLLEWIESF